MSSLVNNGMIRLFEKLPFLPLCQISKHLNACAIYMAADYSEKWEDIVRKRKNVTSVWEIHIIGEQLKFLITFNDTAQNFYLRTKKESIEGLGEPFPEELQFLCFKTLKRLYQFFPPASLRQIYVALGSTSPDFPFRFLSQLPRVTAEYIHLQGDLEVDGADLIKFLENVRVKDGTGWFLKYRLDIQVRIKNLVMSDKIRLKNNYLEIRDARFLTRESTPKLGAFQVQLGLNNFTSQDLNAFLKWWMVDGRQSRSGRSLYTIDIREDQDIKLEEVMEGLNVHGQRTRDRWHFHHPKGNEPHLLLHPIATDMNGGLDITNSQGTLGTVLLEPDRFTFVTWTPSFTWEFYKNDMRTLIRRFDDDVSKEQRTLKWSESKVEGSSKCRPLHDTYGQRIKQLEYALAIGSDIYHKLITEWNND